MASTLSRIRASALPRLIDQAAGAPLLWLLGAVRRRRPVPAAPRRFGIMMYETLGDTLLAGTVVASLRASFPQAQVIVFASGGNRAAVDLFEGVGAVVQVPLTRPLQAIRAIRSIRVDVMIDIGQWPRWYALLCAASRSAHTVGFATPGQFRHYAYDTAVPHRRDVHETENFRSLLSPWPGARALPPAAALKPVGAPPGRLALSGPYLVFHPWASGFRFEAREWPLGRWIELTERVGRLGLPVLVTGSAADRPKAQALVAACSGESAVTSVAGALSVPELASVLRGAAVVVAVNTGVMHLAALVGAPLLALHGPTSRRRWGPVGPRSIALAPAGGGPSEFLHLGFEYPKGPVDCMERIEVDEVFAALRTLLPPPARAAAGSG